jgi:hypothetical protein
MASPYQGDDEDPFSGARDEEGNIKRAPAKKRVVTKEEMKKAGFDNLRDFLNAERGLKRKDAGPSEATVARIDRKAKEELKGPSEADIDRMVKKFDRPSFADMKGKTMKEKMAAMRGQGMKKGGMVSASKRADGCAIKGKTRGKMV